MSTKVDQSSPSSQKITMLKSKSGFVIPKNKLSGSLVPAFRRGKKLGSNDVEDEESTKRVQRKTRWGTDLTQDASVKKDRALAYQTRSDQITQLLKSGVLDLDVAKNQNSPLDVKVPDRDSSGHPIEDETLKLLELERQEVIGEILKLNPSYKAPSDYKPILKEASIPIPVKDYPGYDFIGIICGPGSDTVKRLEKETGAKLQIYGTKPVTGEKCEISQSDGTENHIAYEDLHVHVAADTFEKVDAAVALIELLLTPISGTLAAVTPTSTSVSAESANVLNQSQDPATPFTAPTLVANQGVVQPVTGHGQIPSQTLPNPWIASAPPSTALPPSSGFISLPASVPILRRPVQLSTHPFNPPPAMPSLFNAPPAPASGFGSVLPNQSLPLGLQQPMQGVQQQHMHLASSLSHNGPAGNPSISGPQAPPIQLIAPAIFTTGQSTSTGFPSTSRPLMPLLPPFVPRLSQGMLPDQPLTPAGSGSSSGWSRGPTGNASLGPSNVMQMSPPVVPPPNFHPVASQSTAPRAPPNTSAAIALPLSSYPFQPSGPQSSNSFVNQPAAIPMSSAQLQASLPPMPMLAVTAVAPFSNPSPTLLGSVPVPLPVASPSAPPVQSGTSTSVSGTLPSYNPPKPPSVTAPRLQTPSPGDFTFQPLRAQNLDSQAVPRPSNLPVDQSPMLSPMGQPPLVPQTPPFRPPLASGPQPMLQSFPRLQVGNQIGQPQAQVSPGPLVGSPNAILARPRLPSFPSVSNVQVPPLAVRNSSPALQMPNMAAPFPLRPGNPPQLRQNYPASLTQPANSMAPNQQLSNSFAFSKPASSSSGGQQVYDPFSPTSVSNVPQQAGDASRAGRQENDPEYEDLMASVGVR